MNEGQTVVERNGGSYYIVEVKWKYIALDGERMGLARWFEGRLLFVAPGMSSRQKMTIKVL